MTFERSVALIAAQERVRNHPMYASIRTIAHVRTLMEHHVFAVWDFMSLLKSLQQKITCTSVPWIPSPQSEHARLINEIVLAEESDEDGQGGYASHFALYIEAMRECGADISKINTFIAQLQHGIAPHAALEPAPHTVRQFVLHTLHIASHGSSHEAAAAFFFGREDMLPEVFSRLAQQLHAHGVRTPRLTYYYERHIALDGDSHGPLAERLLTHLCTTQQHHEEATQAAIASLEHRARLWDGVLEQLEHME